LKKVNVCLIDDDPIQIFLMKKYLEKTGFANNVLDFPNGKLAYEYFSSQNYIMFDVIFLDINMPVWDGWEFLKEFSRLEIYKQVQVFLLTSSQSPFDREQANVYMLDNCYYSKPISYESIQKILKIYIESISNRL
jgi:CheY-like chemotaxis protein